MRICFSVTNLALGGAQVFVCRLAGFVAGKGHTVFLYDHWPEHRETGIAGLPGPGVQLLSYSENPLFRGIVWKVNAALKLLGLHKNFRHHLNRISFFRQMRVRRVELVNSQMQFSDEVIGGSKRELPFRLVVTLHGEYEMLSAMLGRGTAEKKFRAVAEKLDALVYTADKNLLFFRAQQDPSVIVRKIHIGIDPDAFPRREIKKQMLGFAETDVLVGMVSRGIPEKGWDTCIDVVAKFNAASQRKVKLVLIGNGDYLRGLVDRKATSDMKLIQFEGDIDGYFSYYQLFDIFLFPTRFAGESFPNVVLESLYWGVPVIATNAGAVAEMINAGLEDAAGFCIDVGSADPTTAFINALSQLVADASLRLKMKQNAKNGFQRFYIGDVADRYLEVFGRCIARDK